MVGPKRIWHIGFDEVDIIVTVASFLESYSPLIVCPPEAMDNLELHRTPDIWIQMLSVKIMSNFISYERSLMEIYTMKSMSNR